MTDKITYRLEGFKEFEAQIKQLAEGYRSDLVTRNTLVKAVKVALEPAYDNILTAPIPYHINRPSSDNDKPHLRDTLRIDARIPNAKDQMSGYVNKTDAVIGVVSVKKSAVALSMEYGNARVKARPYLSTQFERSAESILNKLKSELSYIIPAYAKKLNKRGIK